MKTAQNEDCAADVAAITDFYKDDFNLQQLSLHLNILSTNIPGDKGQHDLSSVLVCSELFAVALSATERASV